MKRKPRALILQLVHDRPLTLRSLHSVGTDDPTRTEVHAELVCTGNADSFLEQIVGRLSLEGGVSSVSWERLTDPHSDA